MASLWMRGETGKKVEVPIGGRTVALTAGPGVATAAPSAGTTLIRAGAEPSSPWVLIADHAVHATVNGEPIPTGIRVLDSRDEIRCGPTAAVFTDEHHARVEPFPGAANPVRCARCTCDIAPASPAIRCPVCNSWYHQQEHGDFPCWTAVPFCQACGCATTTDGDGWEPEEF
ncbi:MAG: hypothetical protein NT151_06635 [Acidobacteria bacterium]|nr:hypothetical protein [Acidobacteriota bacterium]